MNDIDREIDQLTETRETPNRDNDGEREKNERREQLREAMIARNAASSPERSATEYILEPELASDITKKEWQEVRSQLGPLLSRIGPLSNLSDEELEWANEMIEVINGWFDINPHLARKRLMRLLGFLQLTRGKEGFQTIMLSTQRQEMSQEVKDKKKGFLEKLFG